MPLKACRECGRAVSTNADFCPGCGTKRPTRAIGVPGMLLIGLVATGAFVAVLDPSPGTAPRRARGGSAGTAPAPAPTNLQYHSAADVNVRAGPGTDYAVAYSVGSGDLLYLFGSNGVWLPVAGGPVAKDTVGFVHRDYVRPGRPADLMLVSHQPVRRDGLRFVTGTVRNTTQHSYAYVQVSINELRSGVVVGSTLANVNNLGPGETWRFEAIMLSDDANEYRIVEVTGIP